MKGHLLWNGMKQLLILSTEHTDINSILITAVTNCTVMILKWRVLVWWSLYTGFLTQRCQVPIPAVPHLQHVYFLGQGIHSHLLRLTQPSTLIGRRTSTSFDGSKFVVRLHGWFMTVHCFIAFGATLQPSMSSLTVDCHSVKAGVGVCSTKRRNSYSISFQLVFN